MRAPDQGWQGGLASAVHMHFCDSKNSIVSDVFLHNVVDTSPCFLPELRAHEHLKPNQSRKDIAIVYNDETRDEFRFKLIPVRRGLPIEIHVVG